MPFIGTTFGCEQISQAAEHLHQNPFMNNLITFTTGFINDVLAFITEDMMSLQKVRNLRTQSQPGNPNVLINGLYLYHKVLVNFINHR